MPIENILGWKKLLSDSFTETNLNEGIDLDGDNQISENEKLDTNGDNSVDEAEAKRFCERNWNALAEKIEFIHVAHETGFSADNPIHELILDESQTFHLDISKIRLAYEKLNDILLYAEQHDSDDLTPIDRMKLVRAAILENGLRITETRTPLFIDNITDGTVDCDTSTDILIAVARKVGWPVHAVIGPAHMFARWTDEGSGPAVNYDVSWGTSLPDALYQVILSVDPSSVSQGVYLNSLSDSGWEASFLTTIAHSLARGDYNRYEDAIDISLEAVALDQVAVNAYGGLGAIYAVTGRTELAIQNYEHAIFLDPNISCAYAGLAAIYASEGNYHLAIENYTKEIELQPSAAAYLDRGMVYLSQNQLEDAVSDFERAIELDPDLSEAYGRIGYCYQQMGDPELALRFYDQAVSNHPTATAYLWRGFAHISLNHFYEALTDLTRSVQMDPTLARAYMGLGVAYAEINDFDSALANFNRAIAMEATAQAYKNRAIFYLERERYESALADFRAALRLNPNDKEVEDDMEKASRMLE